MNNTFVSYAQNAEDVVLWRALKLVSGGTYVDVGAAHPVEDSVTYAFSLRGWRGVNVEPVPEFHRALMDHRPHDRNVAKAAGTEPGTIEFYVFPGTGLSTFDGAVAAERPADGPEPELIQVEVDTLDHILEESWLEGKDIHFLKVDVEGAERDVLVGANLPRWQPWIVVVEATEPTSTKQNHGDWEDLLLDAGYVFCLFDGLNRFYVSPGHPELIETLSYPACVFDQPYERADLRVAIEQTESALDRTARQLEDERHSMLARIDELARRADELRRLADEAALATMQAQTGRTGAEARAAQAQNEVARLRSDVVELRARLGALGQHAHGLATKLDETDRLLAEARHRADDAERHVALIHQTVSWKVTTPLRTVRKSSRRDPAPAVASGSSVAPRRLDASETQGGRSSGVLSPADRVATKALDALHLRLRQAAELLAPDSGGESSASPLTAFESAVASSSLSDQRKVWLAMVVADGRYPDESTMRQVSRALRRGGTGVLMGHLIERFDLSINAGRVGLGGLDIRVGSVVVDVSHTASNDLHTGIQRVVRETASRWFSLPATVPSFWDFETSRLRAMSSSERDRFVGWRDHVHAPGTSFSVRSIEPATEDTLVPWDSVVIVPELAAEAQRCEGYRALVQSGVVSGLSVLGYDLIPVTAAETVADGMPGVFALNLSMVKLATKVSAISEASASDYASFMKAMASQGITGPQVLPHVLPADEPDVRQEAVEVLRRELGLGELPLVLVVGSHEPRKNHLAVLEAAEVLWQSNCWFDLVFMGGSGWKGEEFDVEVERLLAAGYPVHIRKRVTEHELWAGYSLARFTVFPSIVEGYGLPITESLRAGAPVITSDYGAMAEVADGGGTVTIDPRDVDALAAAMRLLVTDDAEIERLRSEAGSRLWKSWQDYADEVWEFLSRP